MLPKKDPDAICRRCRNDVPCIRCGREQYAIGKVTRYGPVCKSCSVYFREKKSCELCGKLTRICHHIERQGRRWRACPKCAITDRASCQACHRHRQLQQANDGRMLCKPCREIGVVACPQCQQPMPAGYGTTRCETCYLNWKLCTRTQIACAGLESEELSEHFAAFSQWLRNESGLQKAAHKINAYLPFFREIDRHWGRVPNFDALLTRFGTAALREAELPVRWLVKQGLVVLDEQAKLDNSDERRIANKIKSFEQGSLARAALEAYHGVLVERLAAGRTSLRSIRLALEPAAALLSMSASLATWPPDQDALDAYLRDAPGQRAAVTGIVNYLRREHDADLTVPKEVRTRSPERRRKRLEDEAIALLDEGPEAKRFERRWHILALRLYQGLSKAKSTRIARLASIVSSDEGVVLRFEEVSYPIPHAPVPGQSARALPSWPKNNNADRLADPDREDDLPRKQRGTCPSASSQPSLSSPRTAERNAPASASGVDDTQGSRKSQISVPHESH